MAHHDEAEELRIMERLVDAIGEHLARGATGAPQNWHDAAGAITERLDAAAKALRNLRVSVYGPRGVDRAIARDAAEHLVGIVVEVQELRRRLIAE